MVATRVFSVSQSAALCRPRNNLACLIGHSMQRQSCDQTYSGTANRTVYMRSLRPFHIAAKSRLFQFPESCNLSVIGTTSADMVSTVLTSVTAPSGFGVGLTQLQAAVACVASTVFILAEHNDRFGGLTAAQSIANHLTAVTALVAAGKIVIVSTDIPTGNTADITKRLSGTQLAYHMQFRDWVMNTLPGLFPGCVFALDHWRGLQDLGTSATAGDILIAAALDSVHPSAFGANEMSKLDIALASGLLPPFSPRIGARGDNWDTSNNPNGNLLNNNGLGYETGNAWSGTAGGVTYAGTKPSSWNPGPNSAMQAGTLTCTGSMVSTSTGNWWQCRVNGTTAANSGPNFTMGPPNLTLANLSVGDKLASYGEFEIDANGVGLSGLSLRTLASLPSSENNQVHLGYTDGSKSWDSILSQGIYQGTWNGDLCVTVAGNEISVGCTVQPQLMVSATVDFTFRVRCLAARKGGIA